MPSDNRDYERAERYGPERWWYPWAVTIIAVAIGFTLGLFIG